MYIRRMYVATGKKRKEVTLLVKVKKIHHSVINIYLVGYIRYRKKKGYFSRREPHTISHRNVKNDFSRERNS